MKNNKFDGIFVAMITPFKSDGSLDIEGIKTNADYYMKQGCAGIVCNGSTGEAINLSREERIQVIEATKETLNGRGLIIAGTGAPTTAAAVEQTQDALKAGADATLVITPFNCIPNTEGLIKHYNMVASVGLPVILYNLPAHTGVEITMDTFDELIKNEKIIGIKESSGNFGLMGNIIRKYGDRVILFTGSDDLILQVFALGAKSAILALGNIAPAQIVDVLTRVQKNDLEGARKTYLKLLPISSAISASVNFPAPVKEAVRLLGRPSSDPRMPTLPVGKAESESIKEALQYAGLL